jgi:hypothetical protein
LVAARAEGCWVADAAGNRYLDGAGGAIVVGIGHADERVVAAMADQARRLAYVHAATFTTEAMERYADDLAPYVPVDDVRAYPVSGGAEAVETALKLARAYHVARGEPGRDVLVARAGSYHGNSLGALDVSGRVSLRAPYLPWLGRAVHVPHVSEYRCPAATHPDRCGEWHAAELERTIVDLGAGRVAAFIGEAIGGATLGAAIPPPDYWAAVAEVCRRHGVLLVVDEVMTGFGRTGRWFGIDHWGVRPDVVVAGKGASSGYWPLGICLASGAVHDEVVGGGGFVHGTTFSHHPVGAAVARAVLGRIVELDLVEASAAKGRRLLGGLTDALGAERHVGEVRGVGLLVAVELVADHERRTAFARSVRLAERVAAEALARGLVVYPSTGCADGVDGDVVLVGPPLVISDDEVDLLVERLAGAVGAAITSVVGG